MFRDVGSSRVVLSPPPAPSCSLIEGAGWWLWRIPPPRHACSELVSDLGDVGAKRSSASGLKVHPRLRRVGLGNLHGLTTLS